MKRGKLTVVGLGPGSEEQQTPEVAGALASADVLHGYAPYLARVPERDGQHRSASDNREELARAEAALRDAAAGLRTVVVSGGDPGVYGMAAAVCEAVEKGPPAWRELDIEILPGVTAMLAVAARVGAPLGHDFCAISLSDNLKPWNVIEERLRAAAKAGFVIALYNPTSRHRPWQLSRALAVLAESLEAPNTPVILGRAVTRPTERIQVTTLAQVDCDSADMSTCIIVGSAHTRVIERDGTAPLVYTPRSLPSPSPETR
jgi:precorrin-3B C17-methyltransferase